MEKNDEENELEPTEESNNSQETDEGGDTNNNSDSSSDSSEQGNGFYENLGSESLSTVIASENIQTVDQDREGIDQDELERAIEKELEEGVKVIAKYLEEESEFIKAYQEMVGKERAIDEVRELKGEGRKMTDEEWEKEVKIATYNAELIYESMEKTEIKPINEEIPENKEDLEIEKEIEQSEEISEPQLSDLKEDVREQEKEIKEIYEGREPPLEQHQVEPFIKEALETVPEPIINEKEAEKLQELDIEEQFETVHLNEFVDELVEKEELEAEQLKEQVEKEELEAQTSKIKEANSELYEVVEIERDGLDQHEVEATIAEALETEPEPIINEKEVEKLQELDIEEQFQTAHLNEFIDELVEKEELEAEQLKEQEEKEKLEAQTSKIKEANSELYEVVEIERDGLDQHEVEATIAEALKTEPESIINEKEAEKLQELDIEEQFETVHLNEYVDELVERQDEDKNIENDKIKQEKENIEQTQDVIHQSTYLQKKLEEQELELELKYEEKDVVEQHQVEAAIEEELKTEPKPIVNEEELEYIKVLEPEKQLEAEVFYEFIEELANKQNEEKEEREDNEEHEEISTEEKVAQIMRELEIPKEINSGETEVETVSQEGKKEQETTTPDEEVVEQLEIEKNKDHQQELEEILKQIGKIEQEAFNEIEQEEEDLDKTIEKNYERAKNLYKQQTGKRPIYANKETKGFKQWLEQKKKSEEKEKPKQKKELKEEKKKEETWKWSLKNWIERATEIDPELKSELKKLVEEYDELEKLIKKYSQLYNKAHREKLSQAEKNELKSLIKALQKIDPIKIELFLGIREIKRYLDEQYYSDFWNKPRVNRIRHRFFTHLSQKYKNLKQAQKKKENSEKILRNWIQQASDEEISPELKALLKEIVENYSELEELVKMFMVLYKKEQFEQISQSEKVQLKRLIKTLQKLEPGKIELFANIRAIKKYLNDQDFDDFSDKKRVNRVISKFFKHISQDYNKQNVKEKKKLYEGSAFFKRYSQSDNFSKISVKVLKDLEKKKDFKNEIPNNKIAKQDLGIVEKSLNNVDKGKITNYRTKLPLKKIINKVDEFEEISKSLLIDIDRDTIIKLLHKEGVREKRFTHNKIPYYFKWINQKIKNSNLSLEFQESLIKYLNYLMKGDTFGIFLPNIKNFSCSSFKIKYLRFGSRKLIRKNLIQKNLIVEYNTESRNIPLFLRNLIHSAGKIEDYMKKNRESNFLRHSRLEDLVLLNNKNILAIEVPIWDNISYITGHIDIISYYHNGKKSGILIADYKPDVKVGKSYDFVSFLPQVCMYGLLLKKAFGLNNNYEIKCLIFNRECCWIFKPDLIYNLREEIREYYNPNRFVEFKDIFGNIQDYLLTYWITMCKLKCLTNFKLDSFLLSIKYELLKILNIENKTTFADIGREILRLINILNENSITPLKSESLSDLVHASQHLFNLNFNKNEQDILINFFNSFQFDLGLWGNNLSYQTTTSLKILHSIQKLCYVFSHGFSKKMIQRGKGETYKEYLMFAYLLSTKFTRNNYFSRLEIIHVSNRTYATFITQRNMLIRYGLIEKVGYARIKGGKYYFLYNLTKKGVMLTKMILKVWNSNFHKEFKIWYRNIKKLYTNWLKNEYPPLDFTVHMVGENRLPEITQKLQGSDPEFKQKVSEALKKIHKQPEYRKKNIASLQRAREAHAKKIDDEFEFLNSLKNKVKMLNLKKRYDMTGPTINSKISEILGSLGINNYINAVHYLEDKDIDEVLSNIKNKKDVVDEIYYINKFIKKLQLTNRIRDTSILLFREAKERGFRIDKRDLRTSAASCIYLGLKVYNSSHTMKALANALHILHKTLILRVKDLKTFIDFELLKKNYQEASISDISKLKEIPNIKEILQCILSLKVSKKRYIIDILKKSNIQEFRIQENLDLLLKHNLINIDNPVKTRAQIYSLSAEGEEYVLKNNITENRQFYIMGLILLFSYDLQLIPHILFYLFKFSELQTNQLLELTKTKSTTLHKNMEILAGINIVDKKKVLKKGHYQNLYFLTEEGLKICNNEVFNNYLYNSFSYNLHKNEIFKILHKDQELTTSQISEYLNLDSVKSYQSLSRLEEKGFLKKRVERKGAKYIAYWKLKT